MDILAIDEAAGYTDAAAARLAKRNGTASLSKAADLDARIPQFVKSPNNPLITNAAQSPITGLGTVYWPYCVDTDGTFCNAPNRYMLYFTTDHDANAGGVALAYSAVPDKDFTVMPGVRYIDVGMQGSAVASLAVSAANDTITHTAHGMLAQQGVRFTNITGATGIAANTTYYLRDVTTNSYKLSPFKTSGGPVDITADGTVTVFKVASQTETGTVLWNESAVNLTAGTGLTATGSTDRISHTAHGMIEGRSVRVTSIGTSGLALDTTYYVRNPQTNSYQVSLTRGGTVLDLADGTVTVVYFGLWFMYYQVEGAGTPSGSGQYKQSTCLAYSPNGVTWTRHGVVLDTMFGLGVVDNTNPGDKHTGYFRPFRVGDGWIGFSLYGGGNYPHYALWRSRDGIKWWAEKRLFTAGGLDITGAMDRQIAWNTMCAFQYRGKLMVLFAAKSFVSGINAGQTENYIVELRPDYRGFVGTPAATFLDRQAIETVSVNEPDCVMATEGKLYAYYRINNESGAICVASAEA